MSKKKLFFFGLICGLTLFIVCSKTEATSYEYIGSTNCAVCHPKKYASWKETLHSKMLQDAKADPSVIFRPNVGSDTDGDGVFDVFDATGPIIGGYAWGKANVKYTVGNNPRLQYFLTDKDNQPSWLSIGENQLYYLPGYWDVKSQIWKSRTASAWNACGGCHVTAYTPYGTSSGTFKEAGIGCEFCHGPGKEHQEACGKCHLGKEGKINKHGGDPKNVHPGKLIPERSAEVCGQCHCKGYSLTATGGKGTFSYPWKESEGLGTRNGAFLPGYILTDYLYSAPTTWYDGIERGGHQEWDGWKWSKHKDYGISCEKCHNPHGSNYSEMTKLDAEDNELCYTCHPSKTKGIHSYHKKNVQTGYTSGTRCTGCHMVETRTNSHTHTFKFISPEVSKSTYAAGIPNSCISCHNGVTAPVKSTDTAIAELATLLAYQTSPTDTSNVVVFPNPFKIKEAKDHRLAFHNLPSGSKVRIYTLSGNLVKEITAGPTGNYVTWEGKNEDEEECARGIYLYIVESPTGDKKTGKFTLIK